MTLTVCPLGAQELWIRAPTFAAALGMFLRRLYWKGEMTENLPSNLVDGAIVLESVIMVDQRLRDQLSEFGEVNSTYPNRLGEKCRNSTRQAPNRCEEPSSSHESKSKLIINENQATLHSQA